MDSTDEKAPRFNVTMTTDELAEVVIALMQSVAALHGVSTARVGDDKEMAARVRDGLVSTTRYLRVDHPLRRAIEKI